MRYLLRTLGHEGQVLSPTFMLVQDYRITLPSGESTPLYHLDAYRLQDPSEAQEIGLEDMLQEGIICVEWPEIIADWLPSSAFALMIELTETHRIAPLHANGRHDDIKKIEQAFKKES